MTSLKLPLRVLALLCSAGTLLASGAGKGHSSPQSEPSPRDTVLNEPLSAQVLGKAPRQIFQRVVQARVFHLGNWTLGTSSSTPASIGRTLASLRPSFVTGLLRVPDHGPLSPREAEAFRVIRSSVEAASRDCRFDVVLNAGSESSPESFVRRMKEISVQARPDAWTLYVPPDDSSLNPAILESAIAAAHAAGQMAGYDGPLSLVPEGIDYLVVRAWDLRLNRHQIDWLRERHRIPLLVELPTTFGTKHSPDVERYIEELDSAGRSSLLTILAENQSGWGYRFAYPVFYPLTEEHEAFDATKDTILMVTIRSLLARFN
jgi:hypothetical protein